MTTYPGIGGAGIAALRLVQGLADRGHDARLLGLQGIQHPLVDIFSYHTDLRSRIWRWGKKWQLRRINAHLAHPREHQNYFGSDVCPHGQALGAAIKSSDIVHLHWVSDMLDYRKTLAEIPRHAKIIWTLHDMTPFTGGCSHSFACEEYRDRCRRCPQLLEEFNQEASRSLARRTAAILPIANRLTVVGPSQWIIDRAARSSAFTNVRMERIANGLELGVFRQKARSVARANLGIPGRKFVVMFVAASLSSELKGLRLLVDAVEGLQTDVHVSYVGRDPMDGAPNSWQWLGAKSTEDDMASVYSAADLLIVPSLAENFPNVICEAMACGLPTAGSNVGGIPEIIEHGRNGFLFAASDVRDMIATIEAAVEKISSDRECWANRCRTYAESNFAMSDCISAYERIYAI